jgi:RNA polymerase sigma-70 factor (ECF subfamily)
VDRHGAAIHRLAVAIVGSDEAGDVTQDVLVRAWQRRGQLQDPAAEAAWLRRIVVNRCLDHRRAANRRVRTIPMTIAEIDADERSKPNVQPPGFDPAIDAALRRLPGEQRAVIALHYLADLAIADVAATLRVPVGTAKSRLAAALERLRRDLGPAR